MITTVLFDVDDTIFDWDVACDNAIKYAADQMGIILPVNYLETFHIANNQLWKDLEKKMFDVQYIYANRFNIIFKQWGVEGDGTLFEKHFANDLFLETPKIDYIDEILEYLVPKYSLNIASNAKYSQQVSRLKKADIIHYFDNVIVSDQLSANKPNKGFFDDCLAITKSKPDETIIIGDSLSADIIGSYNYGIHTIWFNKKKLDESPIEAEHIITDLRQIKDIL